LGKLWSRFASDFLDPLQSAEYNSIKHDFRAGLGGFHPSVGLEDVPGVPAAPEKMRLIGGSTYGTSFFVVEQPKGSTAPKSDPNFSIRSTSLNWYPEALTLRLHLIAMSINNVISFAKIFNRVDPATTTFTRPEEMKEFIRPWQLSVGVTSCSRDTTVSVGDIKSMGKGEVLASYEHRTN
jgi:hypothetical protein